MDLPVLLIVIIVLALIFDYINGFHDAANSIATIVSTKVLTPFHSIIKKEWIFHEKYRTRAQAQASILEYILHFYNCKRIHGTLGYKAPIAYEKEYYKQKKIS